MKICTDHWAQLRAAIESRGLTHLVAKDGATAMENARAELNGQSDPSNYDPLMSANYMIFNMALEVGGMYLMMSKPDGSHYCPLCELNAHAHDVPVGVNPATTWIEGCTDSILAHCIDKKLTSPVQ